MPKHDAEDDSGTDRPKIRRKRAVHVCARCKDLKLKCDLRQPCSACIKAKVESRCVYKPWRDEEPPEIGFSSSTNALVARVQQLEQQLHHISPTSISLSSSPVSGPDEWSDILASFPPIDQCHDLLEKFYLFDTMFRTIHQPSFKRRADRILFSPPSTSPDDAPFLGRMILAMYIGGKNSTTTTTPGSTFYQLDILHRRLVTFMEYRSEDHPEMFNLDYVSMLHMTIFRYMHGSGTSIKLAWLACGKAMNATLLLNLDKEPTELDPMMGVFEAEMRRRTWYIMTISEKILAQATGCSFSIRQYTPTVLPPTLVPDDQLENPLPVSPPSGCVEWSYILAKHQLTSCLSTIHNSRRNYPDGLPLIKLVEAYDLVMDIPKTWDEFLRVKRAVPSDEPPWVFAQACILSLGLNSGVITFLRHALLSSDLSAQAYALPRAVTAAQDLINTVQVYLTHMLFRWTEGRSLNLWTFGIKVFHAAMILAYAVLSDRTPAPSHQIDERVVALDTAIASLGIVTSEDRTGKACESNERALLELKKIRMKIASGRYDFPPECPGIFDPYTGSKVELLHQASPNVTEILATPSTINSINSNGADSGFDIDNLLNWENWEGLFAGPQTGGSQYK